MNRPKSFLWHDYETFGANPMTDRPVQFAAQRTDANLQPIGKPVTRYCAPADDVLPHPMACLITGITPQQALSKGMIETEFARLILDEMMQPGTCSAGYNSIRFDDTVTRNLLYRNLRDPYQREWKNGNSRWDIIDLARMCYALRPAGLEWPLHETGKPSFRLEDLSRANGIEHAEAHDALADVHATIELAKRLRQAQPRLFDWALRMRDKKFVAGLLDPTEPSILLHSSAKIAAERGCTTLVLPLAVDPGRPTAVIAFDLAIDPAALIEESPATIHDLVFTPAADLPADVERLPLKRIASNHVPMIAPLATLKGVDCERIMLDPEQCKRNARLLIDHLPLVRGKVAEVFALPSWGPEESSDPDHMLYSGDFFSAADRQLMDKVLSTPPAELTQHRWPFQDSRLPLMLFRYRARNYPTTLTAKEVEQWDADRKFRLIHGTGPKAFTLDDFRLVASELRELRKYEPQAQRILDKLDAWLLEIGLL
ncbi:MAG: exodeoxyribonuclease I [Xanthomonadales bacterium]|nr:exodeoxyribonuclease I [Xanthomonadales bacterium]